jgi:enamine deaminase RidA (YjgF/YER057c/UK114 family)
MDDKKIIDDEPLFNRKENDDYYDDDNIDEEEQVDPVLKLQDQLEELLVQRDKMLESIHYLWNCIIENRNYVLKKCTQTDFYEFMMNNNQAIVDNDRQIRAVDRELRKVTKQLANK